MAYLLGFGHSSPPPTAKWSLSNNIIIQAARVDSQYIAVTDRKAYENRGFVNEPQHLEFCVSDEPFAIFAPINSAIKQQTSYLRNAEQIKQLILNHIVINPPTIQEQAKTTTELKSLTNRLIKINSTHANDALIKHQIPITNTSGTIYVIDSFVIGRQNLNNNLNYNQQQQITNTNKNNTFDNLIKVLSYFKENVRVFQHFLLKSNLSTILNDGKSGICNNTYKF